ncbi:hypothetical protein GCM10009687_21540 [Asanoa iriomotensis]|uniref:DUF3040 family protein n=2 Tax=Asanoa iriomotensis TaxID=234613 RepID=A0ABQ4CA49_9ACTN|nr:hypothetical protein Air01nite_57520 [Asanoa iriomotensis]
MRHAGTLWGTMTLPEQRDSAPQEGWPDATRTSGVSMPETRPELMREGWLQKRQQKVRDEIERNRRGDYRVPTWVLAALLVAVLAGWLLIVFLNG